MTKHLYSTGLLIGSFLLASSSAIAAGSLVTGKSIVFEEADFSEELTAQKSWTINNPTTDLDTEVYDQKFIVYSAGNNGNRLALSNAGANTTGYISWRVEVPETYTISTFTFGVRLLTLGGATSPGGDDTFSFEYSLDNLTWTTFYSQANNQASVTFTDLTFSESITGSSNELFIRALHTEGTTVSGDSGYFAIASNSTNKSGAVFLGGVDPNSYISVTVAPAVIPEPASFSLILSGLTMLALSSRRFLNKRR